MEPNPKQKQLIESTDGIYLVDAGAGTGKTFTLTRRYAQILSQPDVEPRDILLITFTNNAAEEMKERVINHCEYDALDLQEAPISTFHSLCNQLLFNEGFEAPQLLGIDNYVTSSTRLIESQELEQPSFQEFIRGFKDRHPEYRDFLRLYSNPEQLLDLIYALAAKGVFPTSEGWYQAGERYLDGHLDRFKPILERANQPRPGSGGRTKQSRLRERLGRYHKKCFPPGSPDREDVRGTRGDKQVDAGLVREAFDEDRDELKQFMHDVYFEYIDHALGRNYINFGFLMMLTYVALCERPSLRERNQHPYVMVDEFQDTSEIQFKLSLLLSGENNICVVGDWKQSIYSFQYATVENIQQFQERIVRYRRELNEEGDRVNYPVDDVETIELLRNYRSTQSILDFSESSLTLEATKKEALNTSEILASVVSLDAELETNYTSIEGILSEDEPEAILQEITRIVDHPDYRVETEEGPRPIEYGDIAVLSRTRQFGLDIQEIAREFGIPVAYEGGVELFKTNPSILLLAWLRVMEDVSSREGWTVILEEAGYRYHEIDQILEEVSPAKDGESPDSQSLDRLPANLLEFREYLLEFDDFPASVRAVFDRYRFNNGFSDKIIEVLQRTFQETYMNLGEIIQFIRDNIEAGTTYEVDNRLEENTVTVQTIHAAKGLEYPVVFVGDINRSHFPSSGGGYATPIQYRDPVGLRQKKLFLDDQTPFQYDNWRTELLFKCLSGEYDEERRLMYVAMTRAEQYLYLTAKPEKQSEFFRGLSRDIPVTEIEDPELGPVEVEKVQREQLFVESVEKITPVKLSPHDLIDESIFEEVSGGYGTEFGREVHEFAERYVRGEDDPIERLNSTEQKNQARTLQQYLDGKPGTLTAEKTCILPIDVGDTRYVIEGVIDLIHEDGDRLDIIDYKTDQTTEAMDEYRKQLSVYYHVLRSMHPDRSIRVLLYYTALDDELELEPLSRDELTDLVVTRISDSAPTKEPLAT